MSMNTPGPPDAIIVASQSFSTGVTICETKTTTTVQATPAKKLLRCVWKEGRYTNPDPAEWGGTMKMS